jgi:DNA polymerase I-like protein with 3'-5' exonuclease and polymerase domains
VDVYDLEVEDTHNFFANEICVHNCAKPNAQQMPRKGGIRECFIASEGCKILTSDYGAIELCTLAAVCYRQFGFSTLGDTIKAGKDPHLFTASLILQSDYEELKAGLKKEKKLSPPGGPVSDARQAAKAVNFGVPGGLGATNLVSYAKATYGVDMPLKQAEAWREKLITEVYPELKLYLQSQDLVTLADNLGLDEGFLFSHLFASSFNIGMTLYNLARVISHDFSKGPLLKKDGNPLSPAFVTRLWNLADELLKMSTLEPKEKAQFEKNIQDRKGDWKMWKAFFGGITTTLTGRVRRGVKFTERCNTKFQGLAADGMKLAIFEMVKANHRLVATVHDEAVNDVPVDRAERDARAVEEIMKACMGDVLNYTVPVTVEWKLADTWSK